MLVCYIKSQTHIHSHDLSLPSLSDLPHFQFQFYTTTPKPQNHKTTKKHPTQGQTQPPQPPETRPLRTHSPPNTTTPPKPHPYTPSPPPHHPYRPNPLDHKPPTPVPLSNTQSSPHCFHHTARVPPATKQLPSPFGRRGRCLFRRRLCLGVGILMLRLRWRICDAVGGW